MNPEGLSTLFVHPGDLVEPFFWLLPVICALVGAAICVVGLIRGRLDETALVAGVAFLPALAVVMGDVVLMERSKETEFCTSCHLMQPVEDSTHEANGSLAAIHVMRGAVPTATSCYTCHSGYGLWGTVDAKLAGMRHMLHTVLGSYDLPLEHHGTYNIDACRNCHAESARFRSGDARAAHEAVQEALLSGAMTCTGMCHPAAHPAEARLGTGSEQ